MASFAFEAPALAGAPATWRARRKRLLRWLRDRLAARGVEAQGPTSDVSGWLLAVKAEDGMVTIRLTGRGGAEAVIVDKFGEAEAEYEDTLAACRDALGG